MTACSGSRTSCRALQEASRLPATAKPLVLVSLLVMRSLGLGVGAWSADAPCCDRSSLPHLADPWLKG